MGAAVRLLVRRRVVVVGAAFAAMAVLVVPLGRHLSTSADTAAAVSAAVADAADLSVMSGEPVGPEATYVEPRYLFAVAAPYDLAGLALGLALVAFVCGALLLGGDWRSGAVGALFPLWSARTRVSVQHVLAWAAVLAVAATAAIGVAGVLLLVVARARSGTDGADLVGWLLLSVRCVLLVVVSGVLGAGLAVLARSDVVVVIALLAEVLVAELLVPALVLGWRSPGSRVMAVLLSAGGEPNSGFRCDVPRCEPALALGAGHAAVYVGVVLVVLMSLGLAAVGARRSVWS